MSPTPPLQHGASDCWLLHPARRCSDDDDDERAPVRGQSGEKIKIQQKLKDGEDATVIAKRLTMKIYRMRNGDKSDFQSTIGLSKSRISLMDVGT